MTTPLKILHTSDFHIKVRGNQQRYDEYIHLFSSLEQELQNSFADIYLIAGDIFDVNRPNDVERLLFIKHIQNVLKIDNVK